MKFELPLSKVGNQQGGIHGIIWNAQLSKITTKMASIIQNASFTINEVYWWWLGMWRWPAKVNFDQFTIWAEFPASIPTCPYLNNYLAKFQNSKHQGSLWDYFDEIVMRNVELSGHNMSGEWIQNGMIFGENVAYPNYWSTLYHSFLFQQQLVCI